MNRDETFDFELARWLEEGPYDAPPEPIAAALAHVRAHPKRPRTLGSLWRHAMSGIGLTHLPSQPRRGLMVASVGAALVVVAVAGYWLFSFGPQAGPVGGPSPTPEVTPAASSTMYPEMATVTQTCEVSTAALTTTVGGVVQDRGEVRDCTNTSTDTRLAGEATIIVNSDEYPDGRLLVWGTLALHNDGGAWSGIWTVTSTSTAAAWDFDAVWVGSGGYDGMTALNHVRTTSRYTTLRSWVLETGPAVTGSERCIQTATGTDTPVGEITASRGVVLGCTDTTSDSRVSGQSELHISIDRRADASADVWGTMTLENDHGTWEGFFFGTVDPGYTTHHIQVLLHGTRDYEGLFYRLEVVSDDGANSQLTGEIVAGS